MTATRTLWLAVALAAMATTFPGLSCRPDGDCTDGLDNDGDGNIDLSDPACAAGRANEAPDPVIPECDDGLDNDGDGAIDLEDQGSGSATNPPELHEAVAQCKDGIDNDGDGLIDAPEDPGCDLSLDPDEADGCPDGADCPACGNGIDDDGDGEADYPDDLG